MSKINLYIISIILLLIASLLPFVLKAPNEKIIDVVDHIGVLTAAGSGIVTVLIAILLYNKYGVDKTIVDKNLKVVLDIVEELKKTSVYARSDNTNCTYFISLNFWNTDLSSFGMMERYLDDKVFFKLDYGYSFSHLYDLSQDTFVPKSISESIKSIQLAVLPEITKEDQNERYAVISTKLADYPDTDAVVGKFNGKDMTLREYIQNYQKVKESIKAWFVDKNVEEASLNF